MNGLYARQDFSNKPKVLVSYVATVKAAEKAVLLVKSKRTPTVVIVLVWFDCRCYYFGMV